MSRNRLAFLLALCVLPVFGACGGGESEAPATTETTPAAEASAVDEANAGTVTGSITYAGPDTDTPIAMNADPICAGLHPTAVDTNKIAAKDGKLANVFVYVKAGLEGRTFPTPTEKKEIDQVGCLYTPRVQGIQVGQTLIIKNTDPTLHNVHAIPTTNTEFNQAQPQGLPPIEKVFDKPEVALQIKCDVHPWMSAYVGVLPHPYFAVSGEDGAFTIDKLPAGKYTLEAWHEDLGTATQDVEVTAAGTATVNFDFKPKA